MTVPGADFFVGLQHLCRGSFPAKTAGVLQSTLDEPVAQIVVEQNLPHAARYVENIFGIYHHGGVADYFRER